jgi:hypothetical protein
MCSAYSRINPAIASLFQMFRRKRHYRQHRFSIILPHYFSNCVNMQLNWNLRNRKC